MIEGYGLVEFAEIDSTNEEARRRAVAGERGPLWLRADTQASGRGRRGREWTSKPGNLFATLLLTPPKRKAEWAQLSFAAAIAVCDMVAEFTPSTTVKWPNDVLAEGRKIAGILLETAGEGLAIGIGINLASHPPGTEFPAISLKELGAAPPAPAAALDLLAPHLAKWYEMWRTAGFEPLHEAWLARAEGVGSRIRARLPGSQHVGVFEGIDDEGALLLNENGSVRAIAAADVFFE